VRLAHLHHRNYSTHLSSIQQEESIRKTHRLHSLQEELGKLTVEKEKRREAKIRRDSELKRLERERAETALRAKIAEQEEKLVRKVADLCPYAVEETESSLAEESEEEEYSSSSSEETQGKASPLPQTVLVNRGGTMVQVHLIGKKSHRKKPLRYTEKEARSPDSPGLHRLRLWGLLKRKRKLKPSPPPQRHEVSTRMLEYSQRVKHSFSPTVSAEKQLELQLRGSDLLPLQIQRVSLNLLCRTTKV